MKTISLTKEEEEVLIKMMDIVLRFDGINSLGNVSHFINKIKNENKDD